MITIHKQLHSPDLKVIHAWIKVKQGQEKGKILDWFIFPRIVQSVWSVRDLNWDAVPFFLHSYENVTFITKIHKYEWDESLPFK